VRYLLVFNPRAKRYSRDAEIGLITQATHILGQHISVAYTVPQSNGQQGRYAITDFSRVSADVDCVIAVGGDGTINIVVEAMARQALLPQVALGVIPYGTGNNLVRSFGLERTTDRALVTIRQGYTIRLDIGVVNQQYYCVNASVGLFAYLLARRVTNSLVGYTYEAFRHIGFRPWPLRICYRDAADQMVTLPTQAYIVGAMLNTSYYGSILHMAPNTLSNDGLFDVKLIQATPRYLYPLVFAMILTGQYQLSRYTTTFRARQVEVQSAGPCDWEMDGEVIPPQPRYDLRMAGYVRLCVPAPPSQALASP